jgi:hypothetical protein
MRLIDVAGVIEVIEVEIEGIWDPAAVEEA